MTDKIVPLPDGKCAIDVFADFLHYLYECTRRYIADAHPNGASIWSSLQPTADFVLSHPNGWEGAQQNMMRKAATMAGLIPDTAEGHSRLLFVTEGEASLHFCIRKGLTNDAIKVSRGSGLQQMAAINCFAFQIGEGIVIIDAGGGTIDVSAYKQKEGSKKFEEIAAAQCT